MLTKIFFLGIMGDEIPERRLTRALQRSNSDRIKNNPESSTAQVGSIFSSQKMISSLKIFQYENNLV